jgi:hypothetical protein
VLLRSDMFQNEGDVEYAGEKIGAGFLVVRVSWFEFAGTVEVGAGTNKSTVRRYRLLHGERVLSTSVLMRVAPIQLSRQRKNSKVIEHCLDEAEERRIEDSLFL